MNSNILSDKKALKDLLKEVLSEFFTERKDILEDALLEVIEEIGLSQAIDDELKTKSIGKDEFMKKLNES